MWNSPNGLVKCQLSATSAKNFSMKSSQYLPPKAPGWLLGWRQKFPLINHPRPPPRNHQFCIAVRSQKWSPAQGQEGVPLTFAPSPSLPSLYPHSLSPLPSSFLGSILIHNRLSGSFELWICFGLKLLIRCSINRNDQTGLDDLASWLLWASGATSCSYVPITHNNLQSSESRRKSNIELAEIVTL